MDGFTRRSVVGTAAGLIGGLAGCLGSGSGSGGGGTTSGTADGSGDGTAPTDHPAARKLDAQPRRGPPPAESDGTVVAFEDPSCPRCARFEAETVPELRGLAERGRLTLFFRGYPVVYPWGEPASAALEAAYDRNAAAFRSLADAYFDNQDEITGDNVYDRTAEYLAATDVDGEAVVGDVRSGAYADAVDVDLTAGRDAGIDATPTVVLFKNGSERTRLSGTASADAITTALGL